MRGGCAHPRNEESTEILACPGSHLYNTGALLWVQPGLVYWCKLGTSKKFKRKRDAAQAQCLVGISHWVCLIEATEMLLLLQRSLSNAR